VSIAQTIGNSSICKVYENDIRERIDNLGSPRSRVVILDKMLVLDLEKLSRSDLILPRTSPRWQLLVTSGHGQQADKLSEGGIRASCETLSLINGDFGQR
jgi:hypothetical protein